jgi:NADH-ubiquinone oxidoreductase chain 3
VIWSIAVILIIAFFVAFNLVKKEKEILKRANSQFECGFNLINPSQIPFSFQFFLVALLFLIFDIEIVLILSYPLEPVRRKSLAVMLRFLTTLLRGLVYEWQKRKLNWSNWMVNKSFAKISTTPTSTVAYTLNAESLRLSEILLT